jgi:hypothetical protein
VTASGYNPVSNPNKEAVLRRFRIALLVLVMAVIGASCASNDDDGSDATDAPASASAPSLAFGDVEESVEGDVVTLPVDVAGIEIVKADGDTSGDSGHFHVFVDREPVGVGKAIPKERGVVHSADNPIKVWGLEPGSHEFTVVVGDGTHQRILGDLEDSVTVDVKGPGVQGTPTVDGDEVTVDLKSEGVEIVKADGEASTESGHYHVLVDPASPPEAGKVIPEGNDETIFHTAEDSVTIPDLAKGEHIIWVVLGNGTHMAFDPPVMDKLTVTIE